MAPGMEHRATPQIPLNPQPVEVVVRMEYLNRERILFSANRFFCFLPLLSTLWDKEHTPLTSVCSLCLGLLPCLPTFINFATLTFCTPSWFLPQGLCPCCLLCLNCSVPRSHMPGSLSFRTQLKSPVQRAFFVFFPFNFTEV